MESTVALRIKQSRIHRGLSLQDVADRIGVSKQMISKYEAGLSMPGSDKLIALSVLFGQKVDYFFRKPEVEIGEINFRKKSSFSNKRINSLKEEVRNQIENYLYVENICELKSQFSNPLSDIQIQSKDDILSATDTLRNAWNIGTDTIHNIIQLLEDNEIKVIEIEEDSAHFDGLATVVDSKYYVIVINNQMPVERKRFTLLHELGHLLLSMSHLSPKEQESCANIFASEMLLAKKNIIVEFGIPRSKITMEELKNIQRKYGISISAIIYKLGDLKIISQEKLASYYKQINFNKKLKQEMEESRFRGNENSNRFDNLVYRAVSEGYISLSKASALLQLPLESLKINVEATIR